MTRLFKIFPVGIAAAIVLSGCATFDVPDKPAIPDTSALVSGAPAGYFNASAEVRPADAKWWESFGDADMIRLIETALTDNRALSVARADADIARAGLTRSKLETDYFTGSRAGADLGRAAAPNRDVDLTMSGGVSAGLEYDAFGRLDAAIKTAELAVEIAEQNRRELAVNIAGQTALVYVDLRGAQRRLAVAKDSAQSQKQSLDLLRDLFNNGRATALDTGRAEAQYRTTLAELPRFQAGIDAAIARLSVLTGQSAAQPGPDLTSLALNPRDLPALKSGMNIGAPADMLRRRPDIRAAELEIARRLALSDIERARLFPVITLSGEVSALLGGNNRIDQLSSIGFGIGPAIVWEGPDLRRVRADIDISDAQTVRAYSVYEQAVLQALSDVEIALSGAVNARNRDSDLRAAVNSAADALELARLRFDEGVDDFLDVLDAQRTLLAAQDRLAENEIQTTRLTVQTYQELGGFE